MPEKIGSKTFQTQAGNENKDFLFPTRKSLFTEMMKAAFTIALLFGISLLVRSHVDVSYCLGTDLWFSCESHPWIPNWLRIVHLLMEYSEEPRELCRRWIWYVGRYVSVTLIDALGLCKLLFPNMNTTVCTQIVKNICGAGCENTPEQYQTFLLYELILSDAVRLRVSASVLARVVLTSR